MQRRVKDFLVEYVRNGNTIFISTHILEIAEEICSGVAILHRGNLLHTGPVAALREQGLSLSDFFLALVQKGEHARAL
jgi:ABC-2 type transport system ATP-binding protein